MTDNSEHKTQIYLQIKQEKDALKKVGKRRRFPSVSVGSIRATLQSTIESDGKKEATNEARRKGKEILDMNKEKKRLRMGQNNSNELAQLVMQLKFQIWEGQTVFSKTAML